jgi:methyl-accepting chemotaxis protein
MFKKYPSVKPLFKKTSIKEQKKKLLASLVLVIQNLRHPDKLTPVLQDMGARHVGYGAKPAHYDAVGENLLAVLGEVAGSAWTPQVKQAWTEAYGAIKTIMLAGAERAHSTQGEKTMSKAKEKKGAAAGTDMLGFYLGALDQSQNNILLCDRNLVITYANSTAKRRSLRSRRKSRRCCRNSMPLQSSASASTTFTWIRASNAGSCRTLPTCRTGRIFRSDR